MSEGGKAAELDGASLERRQEETLGFFGVAMRAMWECQSPQVRGQFRLMMWRNYIIKRRKFWEIMKGWILPVLVFMVLWLLYLEFPTVLGSVRTVEEKIRKFNDDKVYEGIKDADDLFGGGDDDYLFMKVQREIIDVSLNSYLEQVGTPRLRSFWFYC